MKKTALHRILTVSIFSLAIGLMSQTGYSQGGGGGGGGGVGSGAEGGGFGGGDGAFGAGRVSGREDIQDNRSATNTGENNITLGGGQGAANNMNFLNALFSGNAGNQNVNQNTPLKGRGIRAPLRLGFKFDGQSLDAGLKKLNARIVRIPRFKNSKITGVLRDKTLHLIGEVSSPEEASLAARIARFEPGVDQVKNLLTVAEPLN